MKRNLIGLLCVCMLLSGCTGGSPQPIQTDPPETETGNALSALPLLEQGIAVGECGNLLYIPNEAVESMIRPEVRLFGNGLLLSAYIRNQYVLRHISLDDGALLRECSLSASPGVKVRIGSSCIGLLDSGTNRFLLLNEDLTVRSTQSIPTEGDSWYLSPELDMLYRFYYAAFVREEDGYILIAFNGFQLRPETVYHEFSHVIDRRLSWDAQIREDALYSEEGWLALQPEGFAYAMSYTNMPEETRRYVETGYFISDYSMTYPTEDRATLVAAAMTKSFLLETSPGLQEKLDYYARCIRDCFNTALWPEVAPWERPLQ